MESIFLTTKDGVKIAANLYEVSLRKIEGWLVLTHMMPATKESFQRFAEKFQNIGYESIAIDLRGHGESTDAELRGTDAELREQIQKLDYRKFSDEEHQKSILDLESAVDYLIKNRGAESDKISFVGASIGANLSLQYISEHQEFKTAILLSPGLNYRGIKTEPMVKNLKAGQKVFFVSARDDGGNAEENQKLYGLTPENVINKIKIYDSGGHGTDILSAESGSASGGKNQAELITEFIKFLKL